MNTSILEDKFLEIFNRNIPMDEQYSIDEIKNAFLKESYSSGNNKEQLLYIRFFKEFTNKKDMDEFIKFCKTSSTKIKRLYLSFEEIKKLEFGTFWSTRFRLPKIIGKIIPRNSIEYRKIDNFKIYELTPCIAYEMAIRNEDVKKCLDRYYKIFEMSKDMKYILHRFMSKNYFSFVYNIKDKKELDEKYSEYEILYEEKQKNYKKLIKEDYKKFIDNTIDMCTELRLVILNDLKKKITDELVDYYLIYPKGYIRQVADSNSRCVETITNSQKKEKRYVINKDIDDGYQISYEKIIHKEFIQYQGASYKNGEFYVNSVIPNFKRQVNDQNQISMVINFSLPENEILEYIKIIKKKINPKTPAELLGNKLKKANNLSNINTINSKGKKNTLNTTVGENPQNKLADMLYIYDMKKRGFSNTDIIYELDKNNSNKKTVTSDKTIKKYLDIATIYIDKEKYRELISGKVEEK